MSANTPEKLASVVMQYARDVLDKSKVAERTDGLEIIGPRLRADAEALYSAAELIRSLTATSSAAEARIARLEEALNDTILDLSIYTDIGIIRARAIERRARARAALGSAE